MESLLNCFTLENRTGKFVSSNDFVLNCSPVSWECSFTRAALQIYLVQLSKSSAPCSRGLHNKTNARTKPRGVFYRSLQHLEHFAKFRTLWGRGTGTEGHQQHDGQSWVKNCAAELCQKVTHQSLRDFPLGSLPSEGTFHPDL